jgi:UDP-N-acetylglucosamine 2-epimerase (non-hydrolysing)
VRHLPSPLRASYSAAAVKVMYVVGARPNFVKMAPVIAELRRALPDDQHVLVHTGQHYDRMMSAVFVDELGMPAPDYVLRVGSGSHAVQTARVMERIEAVINIEHPDLVMVPGDVNSTLAATLVAAKLGVRLAHVEAGLRSFDRTMPEEINRIVADEFSDHLFIHSDEARENLEAEGIAAERIHFVGNTMIDTLVMMEPRFRGLGAPARLGLAPGEYLLVTLHRPALVDGPMLFGVLSELGKIADELPVVFPVHPRTRKMIEQGSIHPRVQLLEPVGYLEFLSLQADAAGVLTDSGGIQEETTYLGVPCFTLRDNTERPVTVRAGTNTLLGLDPARIADIPAAINRFRGAVPTTPPGWDGHAAERLAAVICGEVSDRGLVGASEAGVAA